MIGLKSNLFSIVIHGYRLVGHRIRNLLASFIILHIFLFKTAPTLSLIKFLSFIRGLIKDHLVIFYELPICIIATDVAQVVGIIARLDFYHIDEVRWPATLIDALSHI